MKVLIISYKADISGGSNRSLLSIIDLLLKENIEIEIILPKKSGRMYEEAKKRNINCIYIPYSRTGMKKSDSCFKKMLQYIYENAKDYYNYLLTILNKSKLKKVRADIVYTNGCAMHAGRQIKKILKIPHVWHIREYYNEESVYPINMYKKIEKDTDRIILISNDLYNEYAKHISSGKLIMISNGIQYVETPERLKHEGINLILTGRITESKGQLDAIQAIEKIFKEKESLKLYFAGKTVTKNDEKYYEIIKQYIQVHKMNDNIIFLGEVEDINEIRRNMDVELMCSSREPFGRVTVEAMRSGLAVIGANSGGTKDIIVDGFNGLLYESRNVQELRKCIELLIKNERLRKEISENAKLFSKTHFTEEQLLKTVDLLKEIALNKQ